MAEESPFSKIASQLDQIPEGVPVVFISYSWDNEAHKQCVLDLSKDLREKFRVYTLLDRYNCGGDDLITFMQKGLKRADRVLIIGTPYYKNKLENAYFWRLIRYIHRNPVKAGIATRVEDYNWSSWHEYINDDPIYFPVCAINILQRQIAKYSNTMEELVKFVNDIVDDEETIFVEMPAPPQYSRLIDDEVVDIIRRQTGHNDPSSFQQLDRETQNNLLVSLKKQGASIKQLQRITGIGRNIIQRAK